MNFIHPTAIISNNVKMGTGNYIGPFCIIEDHVEIGNDNYFHSHVSVGSPAEHKDPFYDPRKQEQKGKVMIGDNNVFREFITINKPTTGITSIANNGFFMRGSHFGHDVIVGNNVIMSCNVTLGGHSQVCEGAYLGLMSCTHPFTIIGEYSMIGMNSTVNKHVRPGTKVVGSPVKFIGANEVGLERANISLTQINSYTKRFEELILANPRKEYV